MNPIVKNILATIAGIIVGSIVNIGIVNVGTAVVPPPDGADVSSMEGLRASMELFKPINFLFPFIAHALGTLAGAFTAAKIAASHNMKFALGVGMWFLIGGSMMAFLVGGPLWFVLSDILIAYIPMGYLGGRLALDCCSTSL